MIGNKTETEILAVRVTRVHKMPRESVIKAFVDLKINDSLLLKGFRIVQGQKGLFVTMPQEKGKNERWYNTIDCLNPDIRKMITYSILQAYGEVSN